MGAGAGGTEAVAGAHEVALVSVDEAVYLG